MYDNPYTHLTNDQLKSFSTEDFYSPSLRHKETLPPIISRSATGDYAALGLHYVAAQHNTLHSLTIWLLG